MTILRGIILVAGFYVATFSCGFAQGFKVEGTKLIDAGNREFVIRGINNAHIWHYKDAYKSLENISELNVNCVRIVWETKGKPKKLKKVIKRCVALEMIPMVELHDVTGDTLIDNLIRMISYYMQEDVKKVLMKYEKYLLLNVANEWGNWWMTDENWRQGYMQAIDSLRKAGYKYTIVIDAANYGQRMDPIFKYGQELIEHDPNKNILFSIHMYGSWNDSIKVAEQLQKANDMGLPLIVGEFGYNYDNGKNNLECKVSHNTILTKCHELDMGHMAWSWAGNNEENAWLDITKDWQTLTWWGNEVFKGNYGIIKTAKKASVF